MKYLIIEGGVKNPSAMNEIIFEEYILECSSNCKKSTIKLPNHLKLQGYKRIEELSLHPHIILINH